MSEVTFLGHKITRNGVSPLHSKVEAVQKWPSPANVRDLQRLLGTVGWYRRFIKNFSEEEQNEQQLQRERYPAPQRQAPDYFGGFVGY